MFRFMLHMAIFRGVRSVLGLGAKAVRLREQAPAHNLPASYYSSTDVSQGISTGHALSFLELFGIGIGAFILLGVLIIAVVALHAWRNPTVNLRDQETTVQNPESESERRNKAQARVVVSTVSHHPHYTPESEPVINNPKKEREAVREAFKKEAMKRWKSANGVK